MKWLIYLIIFISSPVIAEPPDNYPFVSFDQGLQQANKSSKNIFLYFGRYGCGWCDKTNVETFSQEKVKQLFLKNYELVYVDAESGKRLTLPSGERITELELGARLNAFATPLFVYMSPQGEVLFRAPGYKTAGDFISFDKYVRGGYYKTMSIADFQKLP
ncbi:MAG: thioredoxin family protein [Gammaproteobacteria bacterium]|jgi:thioredoxin-related protein